jgi:hypothetical protein
MRVYEATSRFEDREAFVRALREFGFANVEVREVGAFTHLSARKSERAAVIGAVLRF